MFKVIAKIEGRDGTRTITRKARNENHAETLRQGLRRLGKPGDTVTVTRVSVN